MPQPKQNKPRLVNRGGAGLYGKLTPQQKAGIIPDKKPDAPVLSKPRAKYQIAPELQRFAVPIDSIDYDPDNARLHPDGNMEAIKESLLTYGQVVPLVVQKSSNRVVAGNGRLKCARELGWKKIAVHFVDMSDAEAAGYGLADNKTAELAKWDFETDVLKRIYAKVEQARLPMTGWKDHELAVLRMADWVPPEVSDEEFVDDTDEYYTPAKYIEAARRVMGVITLDPASCPLAQRLIKAKKFHTKQDNGLETKWYGRVWLNPPYSDTGSFIEKLLIEIEEGRTDEAIILTNAYTDPKWFHSMIRIGALSCFTEGRISFYKDDPKKTVDGNRMGQIFFYVGPNREAFAWEFKEFGSVVSPYSFKGGEDART